MTTSAPMSRRAIQYRLLSFTRSMSLIGSQSKFRTGDRVWFDPGGSKPREGPYLIASVRPNGRYTLCYEDGDNEAVNEGEEVGESQLRRAS
jgi:hypothetical protein